MAWWDSAWWESAFVQTVTGAVVGIGGAFVGAWWSGKKTAQTAREDRAAQAAEAAEDRRAAAEQAAQDRREAASVSEMDRLHQNRTELIGRLTEHLSEYSNLYVSLDQLIRKMVKAMEGNDFDIFRANFTDFQAKYAREGDRLFALAWDLTIESALYLEPLSADLADDSRRRVNDRHRMILRNLQRPDAIGTQPEPEGAPRLLQLARDEVAFVHAAHRHLLLLLAHLGKRLNPQMEEWFDRQLATIDEDADS